MQHIVEQGKIKPEKELANQLKEKIDNILNDKIENGWLVTEEEKEKYNLLKQSATEQVFEVGDSYYIYYPSNIAVGAELGPDGDKLHMVCDNNPKNEGIFYNNYNDVYRWVGVTIPPNKVRMIYNDFTNMRTDIFIEAYNCLLLRIKK